MARSWEWHSIDHQLLLGEERENEDKVKWRQVITEGYSVPCLFFQFLILSPEFRLLALLFLTHSPCEDQSHSVWEALKSTPWEESGFSPALLGVRYEERILFLAVAQSHSGAERVYITSTYVLEYETGPQVLLSAEGRNWKMSFDGTLNIRSLYSSSWWVKEPPTLADIWPTWQQYRVVIRSCWVKISYLSQY